MSIDIFELDLPSPNVTLDELIPNHNMLRLEVLHRVERDPDGTFIVTPKRHFVTSDILILQSLPHPKELSTTTTGSHILRFDGRERHTTLLLRRPTHQRATKKLAPYGS